MRVNHESVCLCLGRAVRDPQQNIGQARVGLEHVVVKYIEAMRTWNELECGSNVSRARRQSASDPTTDRYRAEAQPHIRERRRRRRRPLAGGPHPGHSLGRPHARAFRQSGSLFLRAFECASGPKPRRTAGHLRARCCRRAKRE